MTPGRTARLDAKKRQDMVTNRPKKHRLRPLASLLLVIALGACASVPSRQAPDQLVGLIQRSAPAVVGIGDGSGVLGSGFRIENTRLIVTAAHVVQALQGAPMVVWNAQKWPVRLAKIDASADLALLEIDAGAPMPGLALASAAQSPAPGQWVVVLGCPFGALPTATVGIVSALPGAVLLPAVLKDRIQLNAAINPGNSGGPVINLDGRVIGVANATVPGGYGLGFAVPVAALLPLLLAQAGGAR